MSFKVRTSLIVVLALTCGSSMAAAEDVFLEPRRFLSEAFGGDVPEPKVLWVTKKIRSEVDAILGHSDGPRRIKQWGRGTRTAWILEEIGKVKPITTGFIVNDGRIEKITVLIYRESRGWEVRYPFFTNQFRGARLVDGLRLDRSIDGISGATLSVNALRRLSRLALFLDANVHGAQQ